MGIQQVFNIKSKNIFLALHQHGMYIKKKIATKYFLQKPGGNQKLHVKHILSYMHGLDEIIILSTI